MKATWHDQPHPHHHQIDHAIHIDIHSDHFGHTTKIHGMIIEVCKGETMQVFANPSAFCRKLFGGRFAHLRVALDLWGWHCTSGRWQRTPSLGGPRTSGALHMHAMNMMMMVMVMVMMSICGHHFSENISGRTDLRFLGAKK